MFQVVRAFVEELIHQIEYWMGLVEEPFSPDREEDRELMMEIAQPLLGGSWLSKFFALGEQNRLDEARDLLMVNLGLEHA